MTELSPSTPPRGERGPDSGLPGRRLRTRWDALSSWAQSLLQLAAVFAVCVLVALAIGYPVVEFSNLTLLVVLGYAVLRLVGRVVRSRRGGGRP